MGQYFQKDPKKYEPISDEDDILFRDLIIGKTIEEANRILFQKDYYYQNVLIHEICEGECEDYCDHDLIVDTKNGKITDFFLSID